MKRFNVLCVCVTILLCTACSGTGQNNSTESLAATSSSTSSADPSSDSHAIAGSLAEYAQFLLTEDEKDSVPHSDTALAVVQRVADGGTVSVADYESAWNAYPQCLQDKGYVAPELVRYPGGTIWYPTTDMNGLTQEQSDKVQQDCIYCWTYNTLDIDTLYRMQIGNQKLTSDSDELLVDCLKKKDLVSASYTANQYAEEEKQYRQDQNNDDFSFDPDNINVAECKVIAGLAGTFSTTAWRPLG